MNKRVVFLDFDGVLNSTEYFRSRGEGDGVLSKEWSIDPAAVARVQRICDAADAAVVVSSTWRINHSVAELRGILIANGLRAQVIGATPWLHTPRGLEIAAWLREWGPHRGPFTGMVILDDDSDMEHLSPWLVNTSFSEGLTDEHVERAIEVLARPMPTGWTVQQPVPHGRTREA